jgi:transcription elongation factor SPT6
VFIHAKCSEAMTLIEDLKLTVEELEQEQQMALINVELVDNELACVFANSKRAEVS